MSESDTPPTGPLNERIENKVWKWRLQAYKELLQLFKEAPENTDPIYEKYSPFIKGIAGDSNAAAQEQGVETVLMFIDRGDPAAKKIGGFIAATLVEKALGSARAKTKQLAIDCLLMLIEIECIEPDVENILKGCVHKVPKVCSTSISVLQMAVKQFGVKVIQPKPILKEVLAYFEHREKVVRPLRYRTSQQRQNVSTSLLTLLTSQYAIAQAISVSCSFS